MRTNDDAAAARPAGSLRLNGMLAPTAANGPGLRLALWVQGCTLACPGCFNPGTHAPGRGTSFSVEFLRDVCARLDASMEGLTLTGGEPLQQPEPVEALLRFVRAETRLGVVISTGYAPHEIEADPARRRIAALADAVVAGRYDADRRVATGFRGSENKTLLLNTGRYTASDFAEVPTTEVVIAADGSLVLSGVEPLRADPAWFGLTTSGAGS